VKVATIALVNLRRLVRDRTALLFLVVLPLGLILVLGTVAGGARPQLGLVVEGDGPLADELADDLAQLEGADVRRIASRDQAVEQLRRQDLGGVVIIPDGFDDAVRQGATAEVPFAATATGSGLRGVVQGPVAELSARARVALVIDERRPVGFDEAYAAAGRAQQEPGLAVRVERPDGEAWTASVAGVDQVAGQQLVLFTFITGLTGAAMLIQVRNLGLSRRMLVSPTPVWAILLGEAAGRWLVTLVQAGLIVVGTAVLFGVDWGSWVGTAMVVGAFTLVAAGASMLVGAAMSNESQAAGFGVAFGLGLAALGGSMVPLEVFGDGIRTVAFATPHAWANDAFDALVRGRSPASDVVPQVLVLVGYAAVLFVAATLVLRRSLTS
jgi:ABC-2 type transport system permease protein